MLLNTHVYGETHATGPVYVAGSPPHCPYWAARLVFVDTTSEEVLVELVDRVVDGVTLVVVVFDDVDEVVFFVVVVLVVVFLVVELVVFLVVVVEDLLVETMLPSTEQGKSRLESDAMLVQKYSEEPLEPTSEVPVAVMSSQISLQTMETTSLLLVPVPVTLM